MACKNCNCGHKDSSPEEMAGLDGTQFVSFWSALLKPANIGKGYQLTLSDPGTQDGYRVKFETDITIFEFFNIYNEYFNGNISLDYDEDSDGTLLDE